MVLECLLVSNDPEVARVLRPALQELSINLQVCDGAESGHQVLTSSKFDAVVVDCDDLAEGRTFLQSIRQEPSNKNSVAFAILNGRTTASQSFEMGSNFVLQKPIQPLNVMRCFSAAVGLMTRERRRYYRVPVAMPVLVTLESGQRAKLEATNISEGGLALESGKQLASQSMVDVQITLPGTSNTLQIKSEMAWVDGTGRAGIRFRSMPQTSRDHLERWLTIQIAGLDPHLVQ